MNNLNEAFILKTISAYFGAAGRKFLNVVYKPNWLGFEKKSQLENVGDFNVYLSEIKINNGNEQGIILGRYIFTTELLITSDYNNVDALVADSLDLQWLILKSLSVPEVASVSLGDVEFNSSFDERESVRVAISSFEVEFVRTYRG